MTLPPSCFTLEDSLPSKCSTPDEFHPNLLNNTSCEAAKVLSFTETRASSGTEVEILDLGQGLEIGILSSKMILALQRSLDINVFSHRLWIVDLGSIDLHWQTSL